MDAALLSSVVRHNKDAFDVPYKSLDHYKEIALPYLGKKAKIDTNVGIEDRDVWIKFLKDRKQAIKEENAKKNAK